MVDPGLQVIEAYSIAANKVVAKIEVLGGTAPYTYTLNMNVTPANTYRITDNMVVATRAITASESKNFMVDVTDSTGSTGSTGNIVPILYAKEQALFNKQNVTYTITRDINLAGGAIVMPYNCTLDFKGGSLYNGVIVGNDTRIIAGIESIFADTASGIASELRGTWAVDEGYPEWVGARANISSLNNRFAIQQCLNAFKCTTLTAKLPYFTKPNEGDVYLLNIPEGHTLKGVRVNAVGLSNNYDIIVSNVTGQITIINVNSYCTVKNINVRCDPTAQRTLQYGVSNSGIIRELTLDSVKVSWAEIGFYLKAYLSKITHCVCTASETGFKIDTDQTLSQEVTSLVFEDCYAGNITKAGYDINNLVYSSLINCACDNAGKYTANISDYPYKLSNCKTISLISCGGESNIKQLYMERCIACSVISCSFVIDIRNAPGTVDYNDLFSFKSCRGINFTSNLLREYTGTIIPAGSMIIKIDGTGLTNLVSIIFDAFTVVATNITNYTDNIAYIEASPSYTIISNLIHSRGNTADRPILGAKNYGTTYYDASLKKMILWNGTEWTNIDGSTLTS